jgi:MFS family permease
MMCFIAFSSEGAVLDWGALLLRDSKNVEGEYAGLGFACFSVAMAVMRLLGDRIVSKVDSKAIVLYGSIIAFAGFTIAILAPGLFTSLIGFALIGVGAANIVPVFFTAAGNLPNVSSSSAIAVMATIGYAGMLAGPAILGFIAERLSLPAALFVAGALLLVSGVLYRFYSFPPHNRPAQTR